MMGAKVLDERWSVLRRRKAPAKRKFIDTGGRTTVTFKGRSTQGDAHGAVNSIAPKLQRYKCLIYIRIYRSQEVLFFVVIPMGFIFLKNIVVIENIIVTFFVTCK